MANDTQKLKLLYLLDILKQKTDENHSLTMAQILTELERYEISAERKSIYSDFKILENYGVEVFGEKDGRDYRYHIGKREFELPELKLLVDLIQSSKFITTKKSNELIKKIEGMVSIYEAKELHRQVYVSERVKTDNENIYYNVDELHYAINNNRQVSFKYFQWNEKKKKVLKHDGMIYEVSPWALMWDDEKYYLIAYDESSDKIKHFRVDKMVDISVIDKPREDNGLFKKKNMAVYAQKRFGMFDGNEENVKLDCKNSMAGVIIDRFGKDISFIPIDEEHFRVNVKVAVSRQFLSWVMGLGDGVIIAGPDSVIDMMKTEIQRLTRTYL